MDEDAVSLELHQIPNVLNHQVMSNQHSRGMAIGTYCFQSLHATACIVHLLAPQGLLEPDCNDYTRYPNINIASMVILPTKLRGTHATDNTFFAFCCPITNWSRYFTSCRTFTCCSCTVRIMSHFARSSRIVRMSISCSGVIFGAVSIPSLCLQMSIEGPALFRAEAPYHASMLQSAREL